MKKLLALIMASAIGCTGLFADQIKLVDGSTLTGKVTEIFDGKVTIKTEFAGDLKIDRAKVKEIITDAPVKAKIAGEDVSGKIEFQNGNQTIGGKTVAPADLQTVWMTDAVDPTLPKPPEPAKWSYEAALNIAGKTGGATEKFSSGGSFTATMKAPEDKLKMYLKGNYAKENGVKNEQEIIGGADYEHHIADTKNTWYLRGEVEHDKINNYERYYTAAAGYGYYFLDNDDFQIRLRAGINYQRKEYVDNMADDDAIGVDFNYHHELKIHEFLGMEEFGKFVTDITYTPTFEDWCDDYRIIHESSIDMPLGGSKFWVLRLGVSNEYNNKVASGADRLETSYFARLVLSWD